MKKTLFLAIALSSIFGFGQVSESLQQLKQTTGAEISLSESTGNPNFIFFRNGSVALRAVGAEAKAQEFVNQHYKAFSLKEASDLVFSETKKDHYGFHNVIYKQSYHGIPVYEGTLKFHFNGNQELTSVNGNTISNIKVDPKPNISASSAATIAQNLVKGQNPVSANLTLEAKSPTLMVFPKGLAQGEVVSSYLVYEVEVTNKNNIREFLYIDAHSGELVEQFTGIHNIDRKLYETNTNASNLVWSEGDVLPGTLNQWQQNEVNAAGHIYNLFKNAFGYVSYDSNDHTMITINNNPNISCPNANWNGISANYCDGTASDDVVAHEWGHAYTEYTSGLIYQWQSGALNESYSDVWGETVDLLNNYQDDGENLDVRTTVACTSTLRRWKLGEDASAFGGAIRDMWNPNCNGDPGSALDSNYYWCTTGDAGGVHINSGVPNHLYALLVDGGTYRGYTIAGFGFVKAAHLWFRAQSVYLTPTSNFASFADALEASLTDLIGQNLQGLSTTTTPAGLSGQTFTTADLANLQNGILAVQLRESVSNQCGFTPLLGATPELCSAADDAPLFKEDWENGIGNWIVTTTPVKPSTWDPRDWTVRANLPGSRTGKAVYAANPIVGDCSLDLDNGLMSLESPLIGIPTFSAGKYEMAFNHYVATESRYDGGNIKYSLNGGAWTVVPLSAFSQNPYNTTLVNTGNDNPMRGQSAFSGTDGGSLSGSWGQSVIDLSKIGVVSGSNVKFRFDFGSDGCNGNDGWYVDEIKIYNCATLAVDNVKKVEGLQVYPNPTSGILNIQNTKNLNVTSAILYNTAGQLVKTFSIGSTKAPALDISELPKGVYLLKITADQEVSTVKVIKK